MKSNDELVVHEQRDRRVHTLFLDDTAGRSRRLGLHMSQELMNHRLMDNRAWATVDGDGRHPLAITNLVKLRDQLTRLVASTHVPPEAVDRGMSWLVRENHALWRTWAEENGYTAGGGQHA